ncbi:MAG: hypothetical protein ACYC6N_26480, partial [Pirellulaceae bacterium]
MTTYDSRLRLEILLRRQRSATRVGGFPIVLWYCVLWYCVCIVRTDAAERTPCDAKASPTARSPVAIPLRWGFDDIGFQRPAPWHQASLTRHPKGDALMRDLGFNFWLMWYPDVAGKWSYEKNREFIRSVDTWCGKHDMEWMLNMLSTVWNNSPEHCIDEQGYDWFCRPDGRRFFMFPDEILLELGRCRHLKGLMYDEAEHHQNNANFVPGLDRASIFDPTGRTLAEAADAHTAAVALIVDHHAHYGLRLFTEHVTPVMFHTFARGGVTAGTKVLKESWSPVAIACA